MWQLASRMGQLKVLSFLGGDGESPGGTPRRLCPGASSRGARCKPGFSGWALDAVGAQTPPCPAVTRRREGSLRLQPLCHGGSAVRGGTHGPFEGGRRALVPAQPGRSLQSDRAVCAGHPPSGTAPCPLTGHSVQQPPGKPGPSTGCVRGQTARQRVCVYLFAAQGVCGCMCGCVF